MQHCCWLPRPACGNAVATTCLIMWAGLRFLRRVRPTCLPHVVMWWCGVDSALRTQRILSCVLPERISTCIPCERGWMMTCGASPVRPLRDSFRGSRKGHSANTDPACTIPLGCNGSPLRCCTWSNTRCRQPFHAQGTATLEVEVWCHAAQWLRTYGIKVNRTSSGSGGSGACVVKALLSY